MPRYIRSVNNLAAPHSHPNPDSAFTGLRTSMHRVGAYVRGCLLGQPASAHHRQREIERIMDQLRVRHAKLHSQLALEIDPVKRKRLLTGLKVIDLQLEKGADRLRELRRD